MPQSPVNSLAEFAEHLFGIGYWAKNGFVFGGGMGFEDMAFEDWWVMMTSDGEMVRSVIISRLSPDFQAEYEDIWYAFVHMHMARGWHGWELEAQHGKYN